MDKYHLILAILEREEAEQWNRLSTAIEEIDECDTESEFDRLRFRLDLYQMSRRLLVEARSLQASQPIALLEASKVS